MARILFALLISVAPLLAQHPPVPPLARGTFLSWSGSNSDGTFDWKTEEGVLYQCSFSSKTYFENDHRRTAIGRIPEGERIEVLAERTQSEPNCRALIVRVVLESPPHRAYSPYSRAPQAATEYFQRRGNITVSGIVLRFDENVLLLRTRDGARKWVVLRPDTRYHAFGQFAERASIPLNRPVFIRGGNNVDRELEAYSIAWGEMLRP